MDVPIQIELKHVFELATLRREASAIQSPRQWQAVRELTDRCNNARTKENDHYAQRYESRVEFRRRQLIAEAGAKSRDFKPSWAGQDKFSPADTLRQAQRDVRSAHNRRVERIDEYERTQLRATVDRFRSENAHRGEARRDFNTVADRRKQVRQMER